MPKISRFFGIAIQMYGNDHPPPHFHAIYNKYRAVIEIETGEIHQGELPGKQLKFVQAWTEIHKDELLKNFETLRAEKQTFKKIKPLS